MLAFYNDEAVRSFYLARVRDHQTQDEIIQGTYWAHGKGCAVGCTLHGDDHSRYEIELGIPRQLAWLQDVIFEGLSNEEAKEFPLAFLEAIPRGADLSRVYPKFMVWMLADPDDGCARFIEEEKPAFDRVVELYQRMADDREISEEAWAAAWGAAWAAASDAAWAAASDAAWGAAWAAASDDAWAAAWAAAWGAAWAAASDAAWGAAWGAAFSKMRDKLLELLCAAPVVAY